MVELVRYYPRRGPIYADVHLLPRQELLDQLKGGKTFQIGRRKSRLGSEFRLQAALYLITASNAEWIKTNTNSSASDDLSPAPIF